MSALADDVDLLSSYRQAHERVLSIEPFEAALRENTPLTSISDPKALTEYLSQISLKGDMVTEELKRVTAERDDYEKQLQSTDTRKEVGQEKKDGQLSIDTTSRPSDSHKPSPSTPSKAGFGGFFSPKVKSPQPQAESEEFFSFDNEIPRLESELKEKQEEVASLKSQAESLKQDLSVARESTEGMVQNLESATRELMELRDVSEKQGEEIKSLKTSKQEDLDALKSKLAPTESSVQEATAEVVQLKAELKQKTDELDKLQNEVSRSDNADQNAEVNAKLEEVNKEKDAKEKRLGVLQGLVDGLRSQLQEAQGSAANLKTELGQKTEDISKVNNIVDSLDAKLKDNPEWQSAKEKLAQGQEVDLDPFLQSLSPAPKEDTPTSQQEPQPAPTTSAAKKKKNKKKKGGKGPDESKTAEPPTETTPSTDPNQEAKSCELEKKIESLSSQLEEKEAAIDRLNSQVKGEDALKEEIDSLRDNLTHIGQDHVEAHDKIKELTAEKSALEETISKLENELAESRTRNESKSADSEQAHNDLKSEFENLKNKATTLETDLSAAQQLAATRFKDLTDLRETLQKIQPELRNLRSESSELRSTKETLISQTADLKAKHDGLSAELKALKSTISDRNAEVKALNQKIKQETDIRLKAEENLSVAQSDLSKSETKKQEAVDAKKKATKDLSKAQEDLKMARAKVREVEDKVSQLSRELEGLREEIQLKTAQHASAQSLMNSMRDQTSEMAMQMKEARERCESLDEEVADAHRLLSERTREGETMRRLLSDIEGRTDSKVRDFRERMEAAIEERDRAEDDASTQGRRRARELEELKVKMREVERSLRTAEEDKEELERSQKDWRRRRDELEGQSEHSAQELNDMRQAVTRLRDSLDESEKQVRDLEKERAELRRSVEETNTRLEKMRKSTRTPSHARGFDSGPQSSRSSVDSGSRPPPRDQGPSSRRSETPTGPGGPSIDYVYLKNVLLQFLEQKDKNYQKQLIPVLAMLLHFDRYVPVPVGLEVVCDTDCVGMMNSGGCRRLPRSDLYIIVHSNTIFIILAMANGQEKKKKARCGIRTRDPQVRK